MKYCLRYKHTRHGRRCAQYAGGGYGDVGDWGDMGALPTNVDTFLAPGIGLVSAMGTSALVAYYGSAGSWATRHSGVIGIGAGAVAATLYGLARGMGAGIAAGVISVAVGVTIELFQYVVAKRLSAAMSTPAAAAAAAAGGTGRMGSMGYIRAKMLAGMGAGGRRGYRPTGGTALLDSVGAGALV